MKTCTILQSNIFQIDGTEVEWSLGFMVNATNSVPVEEPTYRLTRQEYIALLAFCCLVSLIGLAMFVTCLVKRKMEKNLFKYSLIDE